MTAMKNEYGLSKRHTSKATWPMGKWSLPIPLKDSGILLHLVLSVRLCGSWRVVLPRLEQCREAVPARFPKFDEFLKTARGFKIVYISAQASTAKLPHLESVALHG